MSGHSSYKPTTAFGKWLHERLPIMDLVYGQALDACLKALARLGNP